MNIDNLKSKLIGGSQRTATVKKNIIGSLIIKLISIATSFLLVPMTLGYVSTEIYGVWLTISSILHWFTYMDVGFTLGLKNRLSESLAQEDYTKARSLVSTTYMMMAVIFVPFGLLSFLCTPYVDWCSLLNVAPSNQEVIVQTIQILFVFLALQMIANVFVSVVAAHQKVALSNLFNVLGQVFALVIIFAMTQLLPPSLTNLAFAYSLMPIVVVLAASFYYFHTSMRRIAPTFRSIDRHYIKDLWSLGFKFFIIQIQMIVLYQATNILISNIAGPESVTQYNIAYKLLNVVFMVYAIIIGPMWPAFTDAYTRQDYQWMKNTYRKLIHIYAMLCLTMGVLVILSPLIYKIWVGTSVEIPLMLTLSIGIYTLIFCWSSLQATLINGTGKIKLQTYIVLIGLVGHVPLSLLLAQNIGIYGVIASMSLINLIYASFFTIQIRRIINNRATGIWNS